MKKKGFTITELLVTIIILSILTVIVIGSVVKLLDNAKKKYYNTQENMMILAGKEYFTNYRSKLPKKIANIEKVSLKTLVDEKYIDSIQDRNNKACNVDNSYIYAQKRGEEDFQYYAYLECSDYRTEKDTSKPVITFLPNEKKSNSEIHVKMRVSDNKGGDVFYQYGKEKNGNTELQDIKLYKGEEEIILGGEIREDEKAEYQLTGYATDSSGNKTVKKSGKYIVDKNEAPTIESFSIRSSKTSPSYNDVNAYLTLKLKDNSNGTIKICVSNTGYDKNCVWNDTVSSGYSTTSKAWNVGGSLDGNTRTIYLTAKDANGNTARKKITYKVYEECSETTNSYNNLTSCTKKCGSDSYTRETITQDKYTKKECKTRTKSQIDCNLPSCCSSTYVKYSWWEDKCSNSCGIGTQKQYLEYYSTYDTSYYCGTGTGSSSSCTGTSGCPPVDPCASKVVDDVVYKDCDCSTGNRTVITHYKNGCGSSTRTESCSSECSTTPPVDKCKNKEVERTKEGICSKDCGGGKRTDTIYYKNGCGSTTKEVKCNTQACPAVKKPSCELKADGKDGSNGWFKKGKHVKVTFSEKKNATSWSIGNESYDNSTVYEISSSIDKKIKAYVKNSAGDTAECKIHIKYDNEKPKISWGKLLKRSSGERSACRADAVAWMYNSISDDLSGIDKIASYYDHGVSSSKTARDNPGTNDEARSGQDLHCFSLPQGYVKAHIVDKAGNATDDTWSKSG